MKKILLFFLCLSQFSVAQQINILSVKKIKATEGGGYYYPRFSPKSDFVLLTKINYQGLVKYSLTNQNFEIINDDLGAGYALQISDDGKTVLYEKIELINHLRHNSLLTQDLSNKNKKVLVEPTRDNLTGTLINSLPIYVKGKQMVKSAFIPTNTSKPVITIENRKMVLYENGNRKELTPNGKDESYFWCSISPDRTHIVYTVAGKGTYISTIDGTDVVSLGKLNAPQWVGNEYIVGMNDIDDGYRLISSSLKIVSVDGKFSEKLLVRDDISAMYPAASLDGSKIAFNTENGEVYLMDVEFK